MLADTILKTDHGAKVPHGPCCFSVQVLGQTVDVCFSSEVSIISETLRSKKYTVH